MLSSFLQLAIQIAKLAGFSPIVTTASLHNTELLRSLGATHVLDRPLSSSAMLQALSEALGDGVSLTIAYDAISDADTQALAYTALAPGGKLVITLPDIIPAGLKEIGEKASKVVASTQGSSHLPAHNACGEAIFARLTEWLASGAIKVCTASRTRYVRVLTALLYCLFSQTAWKSFRMGLGAFRMV